jgi:hypothetical protein
MSTIKEMIEHPKWYWEEGMLAHPDYKPTQRVRMREGVDEKTWIPALDDPCTLSAICLKIIDEGGSIKKEGKDYVINDTLKSKKLEEIVCEGLLLTWGD